MPLTNSQYDAIMRSYEEKQRAARHRLEHNTETVYQKIPAYEELDRQVASVSIEQGRKLLSGDETALQELKLRQVCEAQLQQSSIQNDGGEQPLHCRPFLCQFF